MMNRTGERLVEVLEEFVSQTADKVQASDVEGLDEAVRDVVGDVLQEKEIKTTQIEDFESKVETIAGDLFDENINKVDTIVQKYLNDYLVKIVAAHVKAALEENYPPTVLMLQALRTTAGKEAVEQAVYEAALRLIQKFLTGLVPQAQPVNQAPPDNRPDIHKGHIVS